MTRWFIQGQKNYIFVGERKLVADKEMRIEDRNREDGHRDRNDVFVEKR